MKQVKICINTIHREPNYLFATLQSLWETLPNTQVNLFVGNLDDAYLESLRDDSRVFVWNMNPDLWKEIESFGFWRKRVGTLLSTLEHSENEDLLICEDDVVFKDGWLEALHQAIGLAPNAFITLYSTLRFSKSDEPIKEYTKPIHVFGFGLLGMFVPAAQVQRLKAYVRRRLGPWCISADDLLTEYINEHEDTRLFATAPSWIDHRGDVSSIPENQSHGLRRAPSF